MDNNIELIKNCNKLCNVLKVAEHLMRNNYDYNNKELHSIFSLIKIITDKMTLDNTFFTISNFKEETKKNPYNTLVGINENDEAFKRFVGISMYSDNKMFSDSELIAEVNAKVEIELKNCPVITFPWERMRIEENIVHVGNKKNPWKQDKYNHEAFLWLPFGVIYIANGNHSIYSGMNKGEGFLKFPDEYCKVFDISRYYDILRFDGTYYNANNGERICEARNFEFGCIYEIGRLIKEKGIKFKGI